MQPKSLALLRLISEQTKPMSVKEFHTIHAESDSEALLNTVLNSHVDIVKGKLILNEAGKSIVEGKGQ
jgi:hypothetical protein